MTRTRSAALSGTFRDSGARHVRRARVQYSRGDISGAHIPDVSGGSGTARATALRLLVLCVLTLLCFGTDAVSAKEFPEILDLHRLPQEPLLYLSGDPATPFVDEEVQKEKAQAFLEKHFAPWKRTAPAHTVEDLLWPFKAYGNREGFGENLRLRSPNWVAAMRTNVREEAFGSLNRPAVALQETSLRLFPTDKPFFLDSDMAGEGYPFDYLQNSAVKPGEALFVSHASADGAWFFCETAYAAGWVDARHLAFVDAAFMERWQRGPWLVVCRNTVPVALFQPDDEPGTFRFTAPLGTLLPVAGDPLLGAFRFVNIPVRNENGMAAIHRGVLPEGAAAPWPLSFTGWNAARLAGEIMGEPYGWGGLLQNRDCSATTRDLLAPFGVWLPRNSAAQAKSGTRFPLEGLPVAEKKARLLAEGLPFRTLVALRGHIMLYIGSWRGEPVVLHTTWGVRTLKDGREGRHVIGKTVITTLTPGAELPDLHPSGTIGERITGFTVLF
ncbi:SH3 domain-containing protein [Aminiphilus circumscriptus]|uniref:SH3 domain-containing protein n=1 Tax=Aminiphilus circumscriptus TaxID=290732 RepID=UPI000478534D|nr:NlpC/P60 family N-terminal domain-containing protein [Aminiphilus circumscriptus]